MKIGKIIEYKVYLSCWDNEFFIQLLFQRKVIKSKFYNEEYYCYRGCIFNFIIYVKFKCNENKIWK